MKRNKLASVGLSVLLLVAAAGCATLVPGPQAGVGPAMESLAREATAPVCGTHQFLR
ncbi:MAG: hypothetical protein OXQ90_19215 [Gammaproteobacteria bacterium]|nr:hypothetical protein [Gammaproteobacteria bacterium]